MTPLNGRAIDVFVSHSSQDKLEFVDGLVQWLTHQAGLKVFYDRNLGSGPVARNLADAIDNCKAAIIVLSTQSVQSRWVEKEYEAFEIEQSRSDFRVATIRLDAVEGFSFLRSFKHIDVEDGRLTARGAALLMDTLFGGRDHAPGRPVYVSRGWREADQPPAGQVCDLLQGAGLKLICDWTGQPTYEVGRVRSLIRGTGGLVAILPSRGANGTSPYVLDEIGMARSAGLPVVVFAPDSIAIKPEWGLQDVVTLDTGKGPASAAEIEDMFGRRIDSFARSLQAPLDGEHIFLGHSLEASTEDRFLTARMMLSRITGLPVIVGGLVREQNAQDAIVQAIRAAALCIIDITNLAHPGLPAKIDFALNSCIEAGIALGARKTLYLTCRGPRRTPPFMFRDRQVWYYDDDLALIGKLRQIAAEHRRMVL